MSARSASFLTDIKDVLAQFGPDGLWDRLLRCLRHGLPQANPRAVAPLSSTSNGSAGTHRFIGTPNDSACPSVTCYVAALTTGEASATDPNPARLSPRLAFPVYVALQETESPHLQSSDSHTHNRPHRSAHACESSVACPPTKQTGREITCPRHWSSPSRPDASVCHIGR